MFRSTTRLVFPRQGNGTFWRSAPSHNSRFLGRASTNSFAKSVSGNTFHGVSRGSLLATTAPARTGLLIPQTRQFFVRSAVPDVLKENVFKGWNRVYGVIFGVNAAIWLGWQSDFLESLLPDEYAPWVRKIENILENHFTVSDETLEDGAPL